MMRVVVLAPISTSLYSRIVVHTLARDSGVEVTGIVVRTPWTLNRIRGIFFQKRLTSAIIMISHCDQGNIPISSQVV